MISQVAFIAVMFGLEHFQALPIDSGCSTVLANRFESVIHHFLGDASSQGMMLDLQRLCSVHVVFPDACLCQFSRVGSLVEVVS